MRTFGLLNFRSIKNLFFHKMASCKLAGILSLVLLNFIICHPVSAQTNSTADTVYHFNLKDCIQYALQHQHDVKNAVLNNQLSSEEIKASTGKLLPHAQINANLVDNLELPTSLIPDFSSGNLNNKIPVKSGVKYTASPNVQVNQTIFNSNYFLGLKAAKIYQELSEKSLNSTQIGTQVNVEKAYFNVLVNEEAIRLATSNVQQIQKSLNDTKAQYKVGIAETVDVNRIQVQANNAQTGIENQRRLLNLSIAELKFQMSMPQTDSLMITETIRDFTPQAIPAADTAGFTLENRPEYQMQQIQNQLNELNIRSVRNSYLPSLSAYLAYGFNFFSPTFGNLFSHGYGNSAVGLNLSFPVFSGTERIHQTNEAKITLEQSQNDLANLKQQIHLQIKSAFVNYQNNQAQLNTQKENMNLTEGVYTRIQYKFEQGVASSLDLLSAENELQQAQSNYIDALLNTLMSSVDLQQALGKINP